MRLVTKTAKKAVFEVSLEDIAAQGFDSIWDRIRANYPQDQYKLYTADKRGHVFFELTPIAL